jgi:hypothetical protein
MPRRKAILEPAFRTLGENHCKKCFGYLGQGVKSRSKYAVTQQELKDIYNKPGNAPDFNRVVATTVCVVDEYNESKGCKKKEKFFDEAHTINPATCDHISRLTAPKDVFKELFLHVVQFSHQQCRLIHPD